MTECTVLSQPDLMLVIIKSVPAVPCSVNGASGCHVRKRRERERLRERERERERETEREREREREKP